MNKQHLIALDLDGTLLTDDKKISDYNKRMINKLIQEGHIVLIATGRSHRMSIMYYDELSLNTPLINSNGALIHHPRDAKWQAIHRPFNKDLAHDVIRISNQMNANNLVAKVIDSIYLDKYDENIMNFYAPSNEKEPIILGDIINKLTLDPTLMMIFPEENSTDKMISTLEDFHVDSLQFRSWGPPLNVLEVMRKGLNKAEALHQVASYFNIPKERIIAFGDEGNDLEMLDYAGIGVAMENGIYELKQIANYVTDTNEGDGVAKFLKDYFKFV